MIVNPLIKELPFKIFIKHIMIMGVILKNRYRVIIMFLFYDRLFTL